MITADCYPITVAPDLHRLFLDYCAELGSARKYYAPTDRWTEAPQRPSHWGGLLDVIAAQSAITLGSGTPAALALDALKAGAGVVVTGQQVGLFGGPLFTPFKAATAIARARAATASGRAHAAIFWLASEDHDFAEINHVVFPARNGLSKLTYANSPQFPCSVGQVVLEASVSPLLDQAWELLGSSDAMDALSAAYQPGRTFAEAFSEFYRRVFAAQGLLVLDASDRSVHRMGAPVLRAALERADELHVALQARDAELIADGYHAQVAVAERSSLLFLIDEKTRARLALKRITPTASEPQGLWQAGRHVLSTPELLAILDAEPERISPSALLRPVFQDYLLSTSLTIGGPAEIAYFAQSEVLFHRILGRMTPAMPRFSATLVEPAIADLITRHGLDLQHLFHENPDSLAQRLAARRIPIEGKQKLADAGIALDGELTQLQEFMTTMDPGLGRAAATAASKMRYQMNRLRRLAANFQLEKEASLRRHADAVCRAIFPGGVLQERVHGAAYYLARYGLELGEEICRQAESTCPGHTAIWL